MTYHPNLPMPRLRLAWVTTELRPGGAERCLANVASQLNGQQFACQVYSLAPAPPPPYDQLVRRLQEAGVPTHFLNCTSKRQVLGARNRLAHLWKRDPPHIVQAFLFHANVVASLAAQRAGVATVNLGIRVADPSRWRLLVERRLARQAARVVCVSQGVALPWQESLPSEKLVVIPNGIDQRALAEVPPADLSAWKIQSQKPLIVAVGRLEPQKGYDGLLPAIAPWLLHQPHAQLVLVGDGSQRAALERQAAKLGIATRVTWTGWQAAPVAITKACDVLVLPSRYEGMPNTVLEAMAVGKPVVAFDVAGVRDLLGPLADEQMAPAGDYAGLIQTLDRLVREPERAAQLGQANATRVADHFRLEAMIGRYEQLFLGLRDGAGQLAAPRSPEAAQVP